MGMFFSGQQLLPVGQSIELSVDLPAGRFSATGEVRYHHAYPEGSGMGIRFTRLGQEDLSLIQKYIEQYG
jgi:PilZ domain